MKPATKKLLLILFVLLIGATCSILAESYLTKSLSALLDINKTDFSMGPAGY